MPIATRTFPADIPGPITQNSLMAGFRDALNGVFGNNALKTYTSGTDQLAVWEIVSNTSTYGRAYYSLRVTAGLVATQAIAASWTDATNTLGNPGTYSHSTTWLANAAISMLGFSTPEYKFLMAFQGSRQQLLGVFRPPDAPAFNEASYPRLFTPGDSFLNSLVPSGLSPYTATSFTTSMGLVNLGTADVFTQQRSMVRGMFVYGATNSGIIARSSDDIASIAGAGLSRGDIFEIAGTNPLERFFVMQGGSGVAALRIGGAP